MDNDMVIKKTNIWGNTSNARGLTTYRRLMKKREIITCEGYPFIDHYTIYAYKPRHQRGPAREEQTFILSYAYNYDAFANETEFINKLSEIGLLFHKERCIYNAMSAYKIFIYEPMCPIEIISQQV
jgi:hypothetical protein